MDTDSAAVGQVIGSEQIEELPLNGRNFQDLMLLAPGAVNNPGGEQTAYRISISGTGISSVSVGGSRGSSEGYTVDGTSILDFGYEDPMFSPSLDDIAEFDLLTKGYSAAYGYSMNQINITSKSGTNSYHGSAFEFLRNNYVDAQPHGALAGQRPSAAAAKPVRGLTWRPGSHSLALQRQKQDILLRQLRGIPAEHRRRRFNYGSQRR